MYRTSFEIVKCPSCGEQMGLVRHTITSIRDEAIDETYSYKGRCQHCNTVFVDDNPLPYPYDADIDPLQCVGMTFQIAPKVYLSLHLDDVVTLRAEPDNEHDPNAIAVHHYGERVAYIKKEQAKEHHDTILSLQGLGRWYIQWKSPRPDRPSMILYWRPTLYEK